MEPISPLTDEARTLRRCVRDVVALSMLSAAWGRTEPQGIAESLTEILLRTLHADFIYVRVNGLDEGVAHEVVCTDQGLEPASRTQDIGTALEPLLKCGGSNPPPTIANPVGSGTLRLAVIPIGYEGSCGFLVAASPQPDFPDQTDRLLLGVGANQAAVVLQHKRAEGLLRRSEAKYRLLAENTTDLISRHDPEGRCLYASPASLSLLGYTPEELVGGSVYATIHADDQMTVRQAHATLLQSSEPGRAIFRVLRKDGGCIRCETASRALRDPETGEVLEILCTSRDVTERMQAEEALRESERRFRAIFDQTFQFAGLLTPDGTVLEVNQTALVFAQIDRAEVIGRPFWETRWWSISEEARRQLRSAIAEAAQGRIVRYEVDVRGAGDRVATVEFSLKPVFGAAGEVVLLIPEGHIITERVRAAAEIRRLNVHLERRVWRLEALRQIDATISSGRDLRQTLAVIIQQVIGPLGVDAADVLLFGEATGMLEFAFGQGLSRHLIDSAGAGSGDLARRVAQGGCPLHVPELAHDPVPDARVHRLLEEGFVAYHGIPLVAEGRVKGVLECFHRTPVEPDLEWLGFAGMLAGQAAIAIGSAALQGGLRASNARLALAYDTTIEALSRAMDLRDHETEGHSRRVTEMTLDLARAIGVGEAELVHLRRGRSCTTSVSWASPTRSCTSPARSRSRSGP